MSVKKKKVYNIDTRLSLLQVAMVGLRQYIFLNPEKVEQHAIKNVNNCWNINISFYLETSGGQNSNLYLIVVYIFNTIVN
jgi:hypothetical protein